MAFCTQCGKKLKDGAKFCTSCGTKVAVSKSSLQDKFKDITAKVSEINESIDWDQKSEQLKEKYEQLKEKGSEFVEKVETKIEEKKQEIEERQEAKEPEVTLEKAAKEATVETLKKRKTWLWVLGWIFVFPLPLTIILSRKTNMNTIFKYAVIGVCWVIYAAAFLPQDSIKQQKAQVYDVVSIAKEEPIDEQPVEANEEVVEIEEQMIAITVEPESTKVVERVKETEVKQSEPDRVEAVKEEEASTEEAKLEETKVEEIAAEEAEAIAPTYTFVDCTGTKYPKQDMPVRNEPISGSKRVGTLTKNQDVIITGQCIETGWYRIKYGDGEAYALNTYLLDEKTVDVVVVAEAPVVEVPVVETVVPEAPSTPAASESMANDSIAITVPEATPVIAEAAPVEAGGDMVWITKNGKRYHRISNCGNSKTSTQVTRQDAISRGLSACGNCNP